MFFSRKPVKPSAEASNIAEKLSVLESIYTTQAVAEFSPEGMVLSDKYALSRHVRLRRRVTDEPPSQRPVP